MSRWSTSHGCLHFLLEFSRGFICNKLFDEVNSYCQEFSCTQMLRSFITLELVTGCALLVVFLIWCTTVKLLDKFWSSWPLRWSSGQRSRFLLRQFKFEYMLATKMQKINKKEAEVGKSLKGNFGHHLKKHSWVSWDFGQWLAHDAHANGIWLFTIRSHEHTQVRKKTGFEAGHSKFSVLVSSRVSKKFHQSYFSSSLRT